MRSTPIWLRVTTWIALAVFVILAASRLLARLLSVEAALVLSAEGATGFEYSMRGVRRTIRWSDISGFQASHRERILLINGVDWSSGPTPKKVTLVVDAKMLGYSAAGLVKEINSYRDLYLE